MAKGGKKKGPPYLNKPDCKYVVIIDPWGMANAQSRNEMDVHRVGTWVRFMLREQGRGTDILVEAVYMRSTQNEVIVQLPYRTNLEPILGEHRWPEFLNSLHGPNSSRTASYIFEYNYRNNGEPGNHNWSDHYPTSELPPKDFPVKISYPSAHYADATRWNHLRSLILPLPLTRQRTPTPPPEDEDFKVDPEIKAEKQDVHITPNPDITVEESQPQPSFIEKYDPYEEEAAAHQLLRAGEAKQEPTDPEIPAITIKQEVTVKQEPTLESIGEYQAVDTFSDGFVPLPPHRFTQNRQDVNVKAEPEGNVTLSDSLSDYTASDALTQAILQYESQRPPMSNGSLAPMVKAEPDTVSILSAQLPKATRDPRRRPINNVPKRPNEEEGDHGLVKKVKTERNW